MVEKRGYKQGLFASDSHEIHFYQQILSEVFLTTPLESQKLTNLYNWLTNSYYSHELGNASFAAVKKINFIHQNHDKELSGAVISLRGFQIEVSKAVIIHILGDVGL